MEHCNINWNKLYIHCFGTAGMQLNGPIGWFTIIPFSLCDLVHTYNLPTLQPLLMQASFQAVNAALFNSDIIYCNLPSEIWWYNPWIWLWEISLRHLYPQKLQWIDPSIPKNLALIGLHFHLKVKTFKLSILYGDSNCIQQWIK